MALEFDAAVHRYRLDGQPVPSVTGVLRRAGVVDYSAVPPEVLAAATTRGQYVHEALAFDDRGELDEETLDPRIALRVAGWRRFRAVHDFEPELIEEPVAMRDGRPRLNFAGRLDRYGQMRREPDAPKRVGALVEIKTGAPMIADLIQAVAYRAALRSTYPGLSIQTVAVVYLDADGGWRCETVPAQLWQDYFKIFCDCLELDEARDRLRLSIQAAGLRIPEALR